MTGVGFIGAGPGVTALHLPTMARACRGLRAVHLADAGGGRAASVAAGVGARSSIGTADVLAAPDVEVVVVASPPALHAEHVLAAMSAGKRAVLCEKPLALTHADVDEVVDAAVRSDVALLTGTNHLFDPAWGRGTHHLAMSGHVRAISLTASLPPNSRYHDVVSEQRSPASARSAPDAREPGVTAAIVRQLVLGLLVHDLPLIRDLTTGEPEVISARFVRPIGCALGMRVGDVLVQATVALQPEGAEALWRMTVDTSTDGFEIDFPPSFVHGGSARIRTFGESATETVHPGRPDDGYVLEWRALMDAMEGAVPVDYEDLRSDAHFAIAVADGAAAAILAGAQA